jgi:hypothetical protein
MAARIGLLGSLARVALADATRQPPAVPLGIFGLVDKLVPVPVARRENLLVAEVHRDSSRMEHVFEQLQRPTQVALPARDVADEEDVERMLAGGREHRGHFARPVDRPTGVGRAPDQAGVRESEPSDSDIL